MSIKSKLSLHFRSDSGSEKIPIEKLEQYKKSIVQCANILEDPLLSESPQKIVDIIRKKLIEQVTKRARVKSSLENIQQISSDSSSLTLSDIQIQIAHKKEELLKLKDTIKEIEISNQKIKEDLKSMKEFNHMKNELGEYLSQSSSLDDQIKDSEEIFSKLRSEELNLKGVLSKNEKSGIAKELAEEQFKRLNIQTAIDSLRAEEEKKIHARHLYLNQKKICLSTQLKELRQKKSDILREAGKIQHLEEEIERLSSLISSEDKRNRIKKSQNIPSNQQVVSKALNKERIGRLISLLFRDGLNQTVIENLAEELSWSKKQTDDFIQIAQGTQEGGIGAMWVDWLNKLVTE
ncbi:hypothetical protein M9Y10_040692 [Tritrichomonas musculus]|uniref:GRIP domain-containing protein n=1 Tax=Tritrichomonas musculus TaxID=1915356 RepID=A0ABR2K2C0_9EUKA